MTLVGFFVSGAVVAPLSPPVTAGDCVGVRRAARPGLPEQLRCEQAIELRNNDFGPPWPQARTLVPCQYETLSRRASFLPEPRDASASFASAVGAW